MQGVISSMLNIFARYHPVALTGHVDQKIIHNHVCIRGLYIHRFAIGRRTFSVQTISPSALSILIWLAVGMAFICSASHHTGTDCGSLI